MGQAVNQVLGCVGSYTVSCALALRRPRDGLIVNGFGCSFGRDFQMPDHQWQDLRPESSSSHALLPTRHFL